MKIQNIPPLSHLPSLLTNSWLVTNVGTLLIRIISCVSVCLFFFNYITALVVQNFLEDLLSSLYFNGKYVEPKHLRTKIFRVAAHKVNMTLNTTDKELSNSVTCSQSRPELSDGSDFS